MYVFQFPSLQLQESPSPAEFARRAENWLSQREAENHVMLSMLARRISPPKDTAGLTARFFTLHDSTSVVAAVIAFPEILHVTWASMEMLPPIIEGLTATGYSLASVHGPGHVAYSLCKAWVERFGGAVETDHSDRVYQLARVTYTPPDQGRLVGAADRDLPVALDWIESLIREKALECAQPAELARRLIAQRELYFWHQPGPVAMAAFVEPTANGGSIRHVYVPPGLRRKGYGKAVIAALGKKVIAGGKRFCFLLTNPEDHGVDMLLQQVGARTICEYARCRIVRP